MVLLPGRGGEVGASKRNVPEQVSNKGEGGQIREAKEFENNRRKQQMDI